MLLIPVKICHQCCWQRQQICCRYRWHLWQICKGGHANVILNPQIVGPNLQSQICKFLRYASPQIASPWIFYYKTEGMKHLLKKFPPFIAKQSKNRCRFVWPNFLFNKIWIRTFYVCICKEKSKEFADLPSFKTAKKFGSANRKNIGYANRKSAKLPHLQKVRKCNKFCKSTNLRICNLWTAHLCKLAICINNTSGTGGKVYRRCRWYQ